MRTELLGALVITTLLVLRVMVPIALTLLIGTLVERRLARPAL